MTAGSDIDGVLVQWGERLFYPHNRIVRSTTPHLSPLGQRAAAIRRRIQATVVQRSPQVIVKVTGGGRGMAAIAAHFRYIMKNGRLPFEDDRGITREGKDALSDVVDQWRHGGMFIDERSARREAFNIMLSMPRSTDPLFVLRAAREFAKDELSDHRYVMVLHDHQANPHVHIGVRAESRHGLRLNPRKADLQRWRETFATRLRGWGIEAEATCQATRGEIRNYEPIWRLKAAEVGRLRAGRHPSKSGGGSERSRREAIVAWVHIARALASSGLAEDRSLAERVKLYVLSTPFALGHEQLLKERLEPRQVIAGRAPALAPEQPTRNSEISRQ